MTWPSLVKLFGINRQFHIQILSAASLIPRTKPYSNSPTNYHQNPEQEISNLLILRTVHFWSHTAVHYFSLNASFLFHAVHFALRTKNILPAFRAGAKGHSRNVITISTSIPHSLTLSTFPRLNFIFIYSLSSGCCFSSSLQRG